MQNLKKNIIAKCIETLQLNYKVAEAEMKEASQAANEVGPPKDRYDPFRSQMARRQNMFMDQCKKILDNIETLKRINTYLPVENVAFGAIVRTSEHKVFFAVSFGKIEVEEEVYFVASNQTPLFEAMKGKKAGDHFEMNNKQFKILEVF